MGLGDGLFPVVEQPHPVTDDRIGNARKITDCFVAGMLMGVVGLQPIARCLEDLAERARPLAAPQGARERTREDTAVGLPFADLARLTATHQYERSGLQRGQGLDRALVGGLSVLPVPAGVDQAEQHPGLAPGRLLGEVHRDQGLGVQLASRLRVGEVSGHQEVSAIHPDAMPGEVDDQRAALGNPPARSPDLSQADAPGGPVGDPPMDQFFIARRYPRRRDLITRLPKRPGHPGHVGLDDLFGNRGNNPAVRPPGMPISNACRAFIRDPHR